MKYRGKYNLRRLLKEMAAKPDNGNWVEWGAQAADPVPDAHKVWVDYDAKKVCKADGTIVAGAAGKTWSDLENDAAIRSMKGYLRQEGGYAKQAWTAEVHGAESGKKGTGADMTLADGTTGEVKGMSGNSLAVPILVGDTVDASNMVAHAKEYIMNAGGSIASGTRKFPESAFDFSKARIGSYGEGGKMAVNVPLKK